VVTTYAVYLEGLPAGPWMAHVPALPGCNVRAATRDAALAQVPDAIQAYLAWLRRHGEPEPGADDPIESEVAGESDGGPFDPGDAAALLPPDREPLTVEEMMVYLRRMGYARADLLALVEGLPESLLDWVPFPGVFPIRRVLRHVGNAEEWYVSRLVAPETLPVEWQRDRDLPLFEFLEMERRTAIARLQDLSEAERSQVVYPAHWTDHPDEGWTARKALRRFVEHEREHTGQVREILEARRRWLLARLAAERAGLLEQLLGLDEAALTEGEVLPGWSAKLMLAHIAAWDRWEERTMRAMVAGAEPDFAAVQDMDAANAAFVAAGRDWTLEETLAEVRAARGAWAGWLESLPLAEFYRPRSYAGYDWTFAAVPLAVQWQHDAEHAAQVAAWRASPWPRTATGAKAVLLAALDAARDELLAAAALVPAGERATAPVCGSWTLQDLLGHIADWEWVGAEGLRQMAAGQAPQVAPIRDLDAWNADHVQARQGQAWQSIWDDLGAARQALREVLESMDRGALAACYPFPWGTTGSSYRWVAVYARHDREHAGELRGLVAA
jgi:predicted RNase H-like HicB family nuclease/uncharacterized damage-inducible protein DinB